jgi:hypothetical protein
LFGVYRLFIGMFFCGGLPPAILPPAYCCRQHAGGSMPPIAENPGHGCVRRFFEKS